MLKILKLLGLILICESVGFIGSYFTFASIPTWYLTLEKPFFSPPNYLFGPVWTILYALMGVSIYRILELPKNYKNKAQATKLFFWQLLFNFLWTPVFFGARNLLGGLVIILIMWFLILRTIQSFARLDKPSSYLLWPYLAWVSFATMLNLSLWVLNK